MPNPNPNLEPLSDAALARLEELHAAATPGEWWISNRRQYKFPTVAGGAGNGQAVATTGGPGGMYAYAADNAESIAALHNAFPDLLSRLRLAEAARTFLRERLTDIRDHEWCEHTDPLPGYTYRELADFALAEDADSAARAAEEDTRRG